MILHDSVALAGAAFKTHSIEYLELSSSISDQALILQKFGRDTDRRTIVAEHVCEVFMSQRHGVRCGAIGAEQQPTGEALHDIVMGIAAGRLTGLHD